MARTRRFVREFNQSGNDYARMNFMNTITFSDMTNRMTGQEIEDENS